MTTTATTHSPTPVTVLGLGAMGSAIARTFLDRGHPVTVWNRTAGKAAPLAEAGASVAAGAAGAAAASPLVVVCLLDDDAVDAVLADVGNAVEGKALVNLTSGSPAQARKTERWAAEHGAEYIDGGIMADPPDLGTPNAHFSFSGSRAAFEAHEPTLMELGNGTYYGEDAGLASVEFMAQVATAYELLIGFLHTLRLVKAEGADPAEFADRVADSIAASYPPLLRGIGKAVRDGEFPPDMGPLSVQAALMDDLIDHRRSTGVDTTRMVEVKRLMDRRIADGHGGEGFSGLFPLLGADS
ncbi:NAD(P)-dependent oxidoreductase [Nocardiopsis chromatogenes]|uniref:NAD(P)-dependent oxidoreductase n=1 Tax=Nocardiopsis chromatogenes TaxID=280239 RepID=UPI000372A5EF|nr:NAD(P)-binding domain-containing protein [Nocardiopsis chromatogenes]